MTLKIAGMGAAGRDGGMFFDVEDLDSDDEEEILEEFMSEHSEQVKNFYALSIDKWLRAFQRQVVIIALHDSEQVAKKKWRCTLDGKEFSTLNIMRAHFKKK